MSVNDRKAVVAEKESVGEIRKRLNEQDNLIQNLTDAVDTLTRVLESVLEPPQPATECDDKDEASASPIANEIGSNNRVVNGAVCHINSLTRRLEL